ncbi:MAG: hypothetical protein J3K34DRAFT_410723 [Monoraphidium minutum]|nr:MAG: hypothetical protein J3K34DRAFT_410723 [Monoraphidium minutum]
MKARAGPARATLRFGGPGARRARAAIAARAAGAPGGRARPAPDGAGSGFVRVGVGSNGVGVKGVLAPTQQGMLPAMGCGGARSAGAARAAAVVGSKGEGRRNGSRRERKAGGRAKMAAAGSPQGAASGALGYHRGARGAVRRGTAMACGGRGLVRTQLCGGARRPRNAGGWREGGGLSGMPAGGAASARAPLGPHAATPGLALGSAQGPGALISVRMGEKASRWGRLGPARARASPRGPAGGRGAGSEGARRDPLNALSTRQRPLRGGGRGRAARGMVGGCVGAG